MFFVSSLVSFKNISNSFKALSISEVLPLLNKYSSRFKATLSLFVMSSVHDAKPLLVSTNSYHFARCLHIF